MLHKLREAVKNLIWHFKSTPVNSVYQEDLLTVLSELGLDKQEVIQNGVHCCFCGDRIEIEDIYALKKEEGELKFICSKPECKIKVDL